MSSNVETSRAAKLVRHLALPKTIMKPGYTYILSNKDNSVLYIGVTNDLLRRLYEHRHHILSGFTDRYNVTKVVYVEQAGTIEDAIAREKQLKHWRREKKYSLIYSTNPEMRDLYEEMVGE